MYRLQGSIKGFTFDETVTNRTAWVGPNQTGKTSRLEAIALALTGERIGGGKPDALAGPNGGAPWARLDSVGLSDQPLGDACVVVPATGLLAMGPSRLREAVAARFGGGEAFTGEAVLAPPTVLTERQAKVWLEGVGAVRAAIETARRKARENEIAPSPIDVLVDLPGWCRSTKQRLGKERTALEARVQSEREAIAATSASPELLTSLEQELREVEQSEAQWKVGTEARARAERLNEAGAALACDVAQLQIAIDVLRDPSELEQQLAGARDTVAQWETSLSILRAMVELLDRSDSGAGTCPMCEAPFMAEHARAAYNNAIIQHEEHLKGLRSVRDGYQAELDQVARHRRDVEREHARLATEQTRIEEGWKSLGTYPLERAAPRVSSSELRARVQAARNAIAARAATERDAERLEVLKLEQDAVKQIEQLAAKRLRDLIAPSVDALNMALHEASTLRPSGPSCYFDVEQSRFVVIGADDEHRTFAGTSRAAWDGAGAEWAQLNLAIARAWSQGVPSIMLIEFERDLAPLDPLNAHKALESLLAAVDRGELLGVYVATSRQEELPEGFNVIHTLPQPADVVATVGKGTVSIPAPVPATRSVLERVATAAPSTAKPRSKRTTRGRK